MSASRATASGALREDDLVAAIRALVEPAAGPRILLGIGDDAALWQPSRSHRSAITTDMLVEGVDFTRDLMPLADAGWRAMAANVSDVAAMGALPVLATVALGIPQTAPPGDVLELYRGMAAMAARAKLAIVGGDLSRAPALVISIAVVGEVRSSNVVTRSGARAGDVLAVTGPLGAARAGLELARRRDPVDESLVAALDAFRRPQPRVAEGRFLGASRNVRAMMDLSDGLSTDLERLCAASSCGARLDRIPVAPSADAFARARGEDAERFALAGGEDFELLVAVRANAFDYLARRFEAHFKRPLLRIGATVAQPGIVWRDAPLARTGWDHFAV